MFQLSIVVLTALANLLIAITVYKRNPKSATHLLLASLSLVTALWTVFNYLALQPGPEATRLFWVKTVMFVTTPYGSIIYMLAETFPRPELGVRNRKLLAFIIFNIVTAVLAISPYMFTELKNTSQGSFELIPGPAILFFAVAFMGFMSAGFVKLILKFRKSSGLLKQQLFLFLVGLIVSFTLLALTNFVAVVVFGTIQLTAMGPPFTLILFFAVAYAIVRHRFLDISYLVARTVSYTLLLVLLVSLYAIILYTGLRIIPGGNNSNVLQALLAIVIAFSFNPLRFTLERLSDRFFFQRRYQTEDLLNQLTHIMAFEINLHKMSSELLALIVKKVRLISAAFIILDGQSVTTVESVGFDEAQLDNPELRKLAFDEKQEHYFVDEIEQPKLKQVLSEQHINAVFRLRVKTKVIGLLVLGHKASGEIITSQDFDLFTIFAPQAAVALQNAQSYQRIQQFSRTLEKKVEERTEELKETQAHALKKAKELLHLKDEFVFIATHDLGTPVTAISGYSSLLRKSKERFTSDTKENIDAIVDASERLNQLTNDLLQVARSDAGTIKIKASPVNIMEVITDTVTQVTPRAKERSIKIHFANSPKKLMVMADPEKLAEVVENLLSNAVKYNTEKGTITVVAKKKNTKEIEMTVADTGIGIPAEMQDKVFTKFFRAQVNGAESVPGTGLGLFVVRMLVEKMGGKISFSSVENRGTTFTVILPIAS